MDPAQQKALAALETYLALSKSATTARIATDLVTQATSHPQTFVFAELLQTPNVQALRHAAPEQAGYLTLLEIFAWGTWGEYTATPNLPPLNEAQSEKLHLLTLLTQSSSHDTLTYSSLLHTLSLPSPRALEALVIRAIYAGLLRAKLNPMQAHVDVSSVSPVRDLAPNSVPGMVHTLEDWEKRCAEVEADIQARIARVREAARARAEERRVEEMMLEKALVGEKVGEGAEGKKRGVGEEEGEGDRMEVDGIEGVGRGGNRGAKRKGPFGAFGGMGKR